MGLLSQDNHGDISFHYVDTWLGTHNAIPLSQSLPLRAVPFNRRECAGFFGGILPEGEKREIIARNLGISAKNDVAMLEEIGGECAGAVTFIPSGESLPAQGNTYRPLTEAEYAPVTTLSFPHAWR
jgi:serine/threonine-protein kinase HipA